MTVYRIITIKMSKLQQQFNNIVKSTQISSDQMP